MKTLRTIVKEIIKQTNYKRIEKYFVEIYESVEIFFHYFEYIKKQNSKIVHCAICLDYHNLNNLNENDLISHKLCFLDLIGNDIHRLHIKNVDIRTALLRAMFSVLKEYDPILIMARKKKQEQQTQETQTQQTQ